MERMRERKTFRSGMAMLGQSVPSFSLFICSSFLSYFPSIFQQQTLTGATTSVLAAEVTDSRTDRVDGEIIQTRQRWFE